MRKFFTLFLGVLLVSALSAQKREAVIMKASVAPVVDGVIDDVWEEANQYPIDQNFIGDLPGFATLPTANPQTETWWKGLWMDDGIYILLHVMDDTYYPNYMGPSGSPDYQYDKTEIYFDVNYILEDGLGCQKGPEGNMGHYQFAPSFTATNIDGNLVEVNNYKYAILVTDPNYVQEYFIPMSRLVNKDGGPIDLTEQVGFDVTIIDRDSEADAKRKRSVWNNVGAGGDEAWANMDECGIITFDGAEAPIFIEQINLTVDGAITVDNQTLKVMAEILPEGASQSIRWSIKKANGGFARATINSDGIIKPVINEEVIVSAMSLDGYILSDTVAVSITGQNPTISELSYIMDGNFDNSVDGKVSTFWETQGNALVTDGVLMFGPDEVLTNMWDYHLLQTTHIPFELKDLDYIISFKAWADAPRTMPLILEDSYDDGNQWDAYFTSTNEYFDGGKVFNVPLTMEPTVFKLEANFSPMKETTGQNFNFQVGLETPKIYIDSIYIISVADLALVSTGISQQKAMESFKVYPNPATSKLTVELSAINARVEIFNSIGVKMDEAVVMGNRHMFDVSRYSKGLYFVKANGAVVKFIK